MLRTIVTRAMAVAAVGMLLAAPAASATTAQVRAGDHLTGAFVKFHTTDNDKDGDSHVTVFVKERDGTIAARVDNDFGRFPDNSDNGPFGLEIVDPASRDDFAGGQVIVRMDPKGHDTWEFTMYVELQFDNGRKKNVQSENLRLTQDGRQQAFPIP
ncbi:MULTISPECIES: hypothetical protein [Amycolatopsis]|uniref:PLAT domain-containing protein n=1 Tax=Amycolatopsis albidoflavus TaxID=102226 RepID=A0ABW5HXT9_9PSEU